MKENLALVLKAVKDGMFDVVESEYIEYQDNEEEPFKQAYEIIGTDIVELAYLDKGIAVVLDENGLLKSENHAIEFSLADKEYCYVGNILFVSQGEETLEPLNEEQIKFLTDNLTFKKKAIRCTTWLL